MEQRKLRVIKPKNSNSQEVIGITIPPKIAMFFENTYFNVEKSGSNILLTSGTKVTDKNIKDLDLKEFKIQ